MNIQQIGLLQITIASFIIFIILKIANPEKSINWIKWYYVLSKEEKGKYNPRIALSRIKKTCLITGVIGVIGFVLSLIISKAIAMISFLIIVLLAASIIYTGQRSSMK